MGTQRIFLHERQQETETIFCASLPINYLKDPKS